MIILVLFTLIVVDAMVHSDKRNKEGKKIDEQVKPLLQISHIKYTVWPKGANRPYLLF